MTILRNSWTAFIPGKSAGYPYRLLYNPASTCGWLCDRRSGPLSDPAPALEKAVPIGSSRRRVRGASLHPDCLNRVDLGCNLQFDGPDLVGRLSDFRPLNRICSVERYIDRLINKDHTKNDC